MVVKQPYAIVIDDDNDFNRVMDFVLRKYGMDVETHTNPHKFIASIKERDPDLCFVDLNIGKLKIGFTLIQALRKKFGPYLPIFVTSQVSDRQSIAHAMELGATDYIVKPVHKELLASKLSRYVVSDQLREVEQTYFPVPDGGVDAQLDINFDLIEIDEFGVQLRSQHLVSKGATLRIKGSILQDITQSEGPLLLTVTSTSVETDSSGFRIYAEFDTRQDRILIAVRRWLAEYDQRDDQIQQEVIDEINALAESH